MSAGRESLKLRSNGLIYEGLISSKSNIFLQLSMGFGPRFSSLTTREREFLPIITDISYISFESAFSNTKEGVYAFE